jgi:hypothetical protein
MISIAVRRTAGAGPGASHGDAERRMYGRALGEGPIGDTLSPDGHALDALVLMTEPAVPGHTVNAQPVALLHLEIDGLAHDEVVCVCHGDDATPLGDLAHPALNEPLCEAVHRLHANHRCIVLGGEDAEHAELALDQARSGFQHLTGAMG